MTRTSSETRAPSDPFRRAFVRLVVALAAAASLLVVLNAIAGPKVESVSMDLDRTLLVNGQLRFFANEPVGSVASVSMSPFVGASASVSGDVVAVQFDRPLNYATDYEVTVEGVTGAFDDSASQFTHAFRTGEPTIYFLSRAETGDEIRATSISSNESRVVYQADKIQEFVHVGDLLAVSTLSPARTSELTLVSLTDGTVEVLQLPSAGTITDLKAMSDGATIGFVLTSDEPDQPSINRQLFTVDLSVDRTFVVATGISGSPLAVLSWDFVAGTTQVVVYALDSSLEQVDLPTGAVVPFGEFEGYAGLSTDGTEAVVAEQLGQVALSLGDRAREVITPTPYQTRLTRGGAARLLRDGLRVQVVSIQNPQTDEFESSIVRDNGAESVPIYQLPIVGSEIVTIYPSSNDQYLAIEVDPPDGGSDFYPVQPRSPGVTTTIVEIATGKVIRNINGFAVAWP